MLDESTRRQNAQEHHLSHRRENLKSQAAAFAFAAVLKNQIRWSLLDLSFDQHVSLCIGSAVKHIIK
jgi:hypothetical protein